MSAEHRRAIHPFCIQRRLCLDDQIWLTVLSGNLLSGHTYSGVRRTTERSGRTAACRQNFNGKLRRQLREEGPKVLERDGGDGQWTDRSLSRRKEDIPPAERILSPSHRCQRPSDCRRLLQQQSDAARFEAQLGSNPAHWRPTRNPFS